MMPLTRRSKVSYFVFLSLIVVFSSLGLSGCGGGGGGDGETVTGDEEGEPVECTNLADCDLDLVLGTCDSNDTDALVTSLKTECDLEADGFSDVACSLYAINTDGTLDLTSTEAVENYSRNNCDNCITVSNPDQADADADGIGDACDAVICTTGDTDADLDNVCDTLDNCPSAYNYDQANIDGDTLGDACDTSDDRDEDADGYTIAAGDCNDADDTVNPGVTTAETIGSPDYNCDGNVGDIENAFFVDGTDSFYDCAGMVADHGECGTYANPFNGSLQEAIDEAKIKGKTILYVYKGTFDVSHVAGTTIDDNAITVVNGGIYCVDADGDVVEPNDCPGSANLKYDPSLYKTKMESGDLSQPFILIEDGSQVTISGFEIVNHGGWYQYAYPVKIVNASPTISGCSLTDDSYAALKIEETGSSTASPVIKDSTFRQTNLSYTAYGIWASISGTGTFAPTIQNNTIIVDDNATPHSTIGVYLYRTTAATTPSTSVPEILENTITVGEGEAVYGVYVKNTAVKINRNTIETDGHDDTATGGDQYYSTGIYVNSAVSVSSDINSNLIKTSLNDTPNLVYSMWLSDTGVSINNNTIVVGQKYSEGGARGIVLSNFGSRTIKIVNNIFTTNTTSDASYAAIYESDASDEDTGENSENPGTIKNNIFDSAIGGIYFNQKYYSSCDMGADGVPLTADDDPDYNPFTCLIDWANHSATTSVSAMESYSGCTDCSGNLSKTSAELGLNSDYTITSASAAIDAGDDGVSIGQNDRAGNDRRADGNGDGSELIDIGCYEYQPVTE